MRRIECDLCRCRVTMQSQEIYVHILGALTVSLKSASSQKSKPRASAQSISNAFDFSFSRSNTIMFISFDELQQR